MKSMGDLGYRAYKNKLFMGGGGGHDAIPALGDEC